MRVRGLDAPSSDARGGEGEGGFTLIELMLSLALLTILVAGLSGVFYAGLRTANTTNHRTDASALAAREIEGMHAVPYDSLGFYNDQTGYAPTWVDPSNSVSYTTVSLGSSTPAGVPSTTQPLTPDPSAAVGFNPDPTPSNASPISMGGVKFSIKRYIVWFDATGSSGTTYSAAYKHTTAIVTWTDQVGAHTVRQDSVVYPGGRGVYAGAGSGTTTSTTAAPPPPTQPALGALGHPAAPADQTQLNASWTQPAGGGAITSYTLQYSTTAGFTAGTTTSISNIAPTATSYAIQSLAASTTYYVQLIAYAGAQSTTSASVSGATAAAPPPCVIGTLTVTGAKSASSTGTILKNTGKMSEDLTLGFTTTGTCSSSYQVKATFNGLPDTGPTVGPYTLANGGSGQYNATVSAETNSGWSTGNHTFTVWDVTNNQATTALKVFKVCSFGSASC